MRKCQCLTESLVPYGGYKIVTSDICGRPVLFKTPEGKEVCGIHKNKYDRRAERFNKPLCTRLEPETKD